MMFLLSRLQATQPPSNCLPFALGRKLGEIGESPIITPVNPTENEDLPKFLAFSVDFSCDNAVSVADCYSVAVGGDLVASCQNIKRSDGVSVRGCFGFSVVPFLPLSSCQVLATGGVVALADCVWLKVGELLPIFAENVVKVSPTVNFRSCVGGLSKKVENFHHCTSPGVQGVENFKACLRFAKGSALITHCQSETVSPTFAVPCRYYPIPEPPPPPVAWLCRVRPPSNRLPFALSRQRKGLPSNQLPFYVNCWHDDMPSVVPNVRTYVVKNTVSATLGGVAFEPMGFSIKCDMNGYCWSGSVELSPTQYAKIKDKLNAERGNEPLITVVVNGYPFTIIAEDVSRSRAFVNHSFSIGGRSVSARLGADYAKSQTNVVNLDNYASQLINSQLADLDFRVERFEIADWLIPANSYAISNKTPIAVINEVVSACGGFVWSDANLPKLYVQKRWKANAWELATANPDVVLSVDVVKSISDNKRQNPRYNTVTLVGNTEAGEVYRERQGRELIAPIETSDLFTDRDCIIGKGQQILSDSGTHAEYTLVMRWADKYNIKLAELGQIWQINDPEGAFKGVVTSVAVDVKLENDVPTVWQTVGVDRYLDL